jgi:(S)-ureidoglycine aminohydrolase
MRPVHQLVHSRTRVRPRYALMPLEGFPASRLPTWPEAEVKVLASPRLGAEFVQYLVDLPAGKRGDFVPDDRVQTFYYVLSGSGGYTNGRGIERGVRPGSFGLTPAGGGGTSFDAREPMRLLVLRKAFEPVKHLPPPQPLHGHESDVKREVWAGNPHSLLQTLVPDDLTYDLAMNIFTFSPGHGLPIVETHVMEHGLYFLEGKGVYYLDGEWMEVERDDFIWMGPYCPQSFYATGPAPARYLYYKNVNREVPL